MTGPARPADDALSAAPVSSGLELARRYAERVVTPLLHDALPRLRFATARLGTGSDVLGLDDEVSRDHDWGLRLTLLVADEADVAVVDRQLADRLPDSFAGFPTRFAATGQPGRHHRVEVATAAGFARSRLGLDPDRRWDAVDWLGLTGQAVLEVTAGAVFSDPVGAVTAVRERLAWYPEDVWRYVVAADWQRIGQELPFLGRTADRGDELGSRLVGARLAGVAVHLAFVLARRWPPYPKWSGTVARALPGADELLAALGDATGGGLVRARTAGLVRALELLHERQRAAGLPTGAAATEPFWDRPHRAVRDSVARLLLDSVSDPAVRALPAGVGSVEQWSDNVDVLARPARRAAAAGAAVGRSPQARWRR